MYQVEIVWNEEFYFIPFGDPIDDKETALRRAGLISNLGARANVKKTRVINTETGEPVNE